MNIFLNQRLGLLSHPFRGRNIRFRSRAARFAMDGSRSLSCVELGVKWLFVKEGIQCLVRSSPLYMGSSVRENTTVTTTTTAGL